MTLTARESIAMQVMWNRLLSVVEEQAQTLIRTSFSPVTRDAGDLSAGIFTPEGLMIAQRKEIAEIEARRSALEDKAAPDAEVK